jgi:Protein of unknown function (DUF4256)
VYLNRRMSKAISAKRKLSSGQAGDLLKTLKARFGKNTKRHEDIEWSKVQSKLEASEEKLWSLNEMELSGGEPDVVGYDKKQDKYIFFDCSAESPKDRRSLCYDDEALDARKEAKPAGSAAGMAEAMGIELLSEEQYRELQQLGDFDLKTSSWLKTPPEIRKHGGAIFGDKRYHHVFMYHNGAISYYGARGFRGVLMV